MGKRAGKSSQTMETRRVLVLRGGPAKTSAKVAEAIIKRLRQSVQSVEVTDASKAGVVASGAADMAVVLGGDGTFLGAARQLLGSDIPVVGVNLGRMGFLTEFSPSQFESHAEAILTGRLEVLPRMMLDVQVCRDACPCFSSPAMNEVSILAGPPFRMIELSVRHRDVEVCTFVGDGLILATPTGSTAYTLSAGGPILMPGMQAIVMTPVAAHSLSIRPVVLSSEDPIEVRPLRANPGTTASVDGQIRQVLQAGDVIRVAASPHRLWVVQNPQWPFFRTLRTKMQWGRNPHG